MKTQHQLALTPTWHLCVGLVLVFLWPLAAETTLRAAAADVRSYESKQVDPQPVLKKAVRIRYPSAIRKRGGEVTLRFLVTREGQVKDIRVVKFSDSEMIDPVYSAYEKATFSPGLKDGAPVDTWLTVIEKAGS